MGAYADTAYDFVPGVLPAGSVDNTELANMPGRTVKGRQTDAGTGVPQDLTGDEVAELFRRNTVQTVDNAGAGVSGNLDITVNDDTTILFIRTSADARLRSLSAGQGGGRELVIEHDRVSGTGMLTLAHNDAGGTLFRLFNPGLQDFVLDRAECCTVRDRSSFWRSQSLARPIRADGLSAIASSLAVPFTVYVPCPSGGAAGTADDVTVWNANAPFALRILDASLLVSTAVVASTAALRTASGGGGSVVLPDNTTPTVTFSTNTVGPHDQTAVATATVAAGGSLFLRRTDRSVVGELILTCVRT